MAMIKSFKERQALGGRPDISLDDVNNLILKPLDSELLGAQ